MHPVTVRIANGEQVVYEADDGASGYVVRSDGYLVVIRSARVDRDTGWVADTVYAPGMWVSVNGGQQTLRNRAEVGQMAVEGEQPS